MKKLRGVNRIKLAKKPTYKSRVKELDRVFSIYIRRKENNVCFTCGSTKNSQCGHYVSRKYLSLRWDELNCHCQCSSCNIFKKGNMDEYARKLELKYGFGILQKLAEIKAKTVKYTVDELDILIKHYTEKIK